MISIKSAMRLYAVTDRAWTTPRQSLESQVEAALRGGVTCVQLREKSMPFDDMLAEAIRLRDLCHAYAVPFIVNDDVEVAVACGADGVHVGQHDARADQVRARIGSKMLLGVSAQTIEQAVWAERNGADYIGVGAVFPTSTKTDADYVTQATLRAICHQLSIPVVAIGGITRANLMALAGMGVDGVAVVSAIFAQPEIEYECRQLKALADRMVEA